LDIEKAEAQAQQASLDLIAIKEAKQNAEDALTKLKATQNQLIQSEKMASLGELTAGIAHEIQNPLNFVNNFSEVSNELIDEMNEELNKGDIEEAKAISKDIKQNLEKINYHGKRADAIVKGMLQHSRKNNGQKEHTDINALCEEYVRLSYHGLRAKDKFFNATIKTTFDSTIGKINIIPQDMGRVIMNLLTNAFYAVNEKARLNAKSSQPVAYEPTVSINTHSLPPRRGVGGEVHITVTDNGNGIPDSIKEKIFQPFFTTKPTGEGTGLGLSLSYDIVTKGHGGAILVQSEPGKYTQFTVQLPIP
jgi:signal transduction histidine kinase